METVAACLLFGFTVLLIMVSIYGCYNTYMDLKYPINSEDTEED